MKIEGDSDSKEIILCINDAIYDGNYREESFQIKGKYNTDKKDVLNFNIDNLVNELYEKYNSEYHFISKIYLQIEIKDPEKRKINKLDFDDILSNPYFLDNISSNPYSEFFNEVKLIYNGNESKLSSELIHLLHSLSMLPSQINIFEKMIFGHENMFIPLPFCFSNNQKKYLPIKNQKISLELSGISFDNIKNVILYCNFIKITNKYLFYEIMENNNYILFEKYDFEKVDCDKNNLQNNMYTNSFSNNSRIIDFIWIYKINDEYESKKYLDIARFTICDINNLLLRVIPSKEANYYNYLMPYQYHFRTPADGVYCYCFCSPINFDDNELNNNSLIENAKITMMHNFKEQIVGNICQHIYFHTYKYVKLNNILQHIEKININENTFIEI